MAIIIETISTPSSAVVRQRGETVLQVQGPVVTPRSQTVATAAERALLAPSFVGQLLIQLDDNTGWIGTGTSPGNWTPSGSSAVVSDAAERILTIPTYVGQLLVQASPLELWVGSSLAAGGWTLLVTA